MRSMLRVGFTNPVIVDEHGRILAGHGRVAAARKLGMTEVPTVCLAGLSEAEKRAYALADNRVALDAGWDAELVKSELAYIAELDLEFDLTLTGFETAEIDLALDGPVSPDDPADRLDGLGGPAVCRPGDLWILDRHRLLCGDALDPASYQQLLGTKRAQLVFTDPPYNVPIDGHACGLGRVRHADFAMASGEMSAEAFIAFLRQALTLHVAHSCDGALHYVCMDWRHMAELLAAGSGLYSELKNLCVWTKDNGGMGSLYRSQHELVFVHKLGTGPHINNVELGRFGRNRSNVWSYPGVGSLNGGRRDELALHPTVKPIALVADVILDASRRGGIILDGFAGSGTTILAAERTGRCGCGIELEPAYVDVAIRRWQQMTGGVARHAATGHRFNDSHRLAAPERRLALPAPARGGR